MQVRRKLLAKDKTRESWVQYIYDSVLATYYEAMAYKVILVEVSHPSRISTIQRNLAFVLRFETHDDLDKFGWKAFKHLKLEDLDEALFKIARNWASSANLDISMVEDWLTSTLPR